jgi:hypothetical protein
MTGFPPSVRRVAVVGDIGGQLIVLQRVLEELGAHPGSGRLPADLAVVQVGDLVRVGGRGLDNAGCVATAARLWDANPGRWVQLLGNHDVALLGGPRRTAWPGPDSADVNVARVLQGWWDEHRARLALAVSCRALGDVLITHAGLTRGRWLHLGAPPDPYAAADLVNADVGAPIDQVILGGALTDVDAGPDGERADVTWAEVIDELYAPWLSAGDAPFTQIHGHASPWNWSTGSWWPAATPAVRAATTVDPTVRRTTAELAAGDGGPLAVGVDWMLGDVPTASTWPPLVLTLAAGCHAP